MSKTFAAKRVTSPSVTIVTTDGSLSVVVSQTAAKTTVVGKLEQGGGDFVVDDGHAVAIGGATSPTVSISGVDVALAGGATIASTAPAISATGGFVQDGGDFTASTDGGAVAIGGATSPTVTMRGADVLVENPAVGSSLALGTGGNIFMFDFGGNVIIAGSQVLANGSGNMQQTMLTTEAVVTLAVANAVYNELTSNDVASLNTVSKLNIIPNAAGTIINSMFVLAGNQNPNRVLWIQNLGTAPAQTLTLSNRSVAGTDGGKFIAPGDFVIPAGGGVTVGFDGSIAPGFWMVRAIPAGGSSGGGFFFDTILTPPAFSFPNNNVPLALGDITLVMYTTDGSPASSRSFRGLLNTNGGNQDGQIVVFLSQNPTSGTLAFENEDAGSTDTNRFRNTGAGQVTGGSFGAVWYRYHVDAGTPANSRWQNISST
jgi:hypothetical protein